MTTRHFLGIAEKLPENWSLSFPAFPGTVTTGCDFADLMDNAHDALASVVAAMTEDGRPIPESFDTLPVTPLHDLTYHRDPRPVLVAANVGGRSVGLT